MKKILFISPSTLDKKSLILSFIVCVIPTLIFGGMFYHALVIRNTHLTVILGCMMALFLGILIGGIICTPHKYILTNSCLIIKRYLRDIVIPLHNIKSIRLLTPDDKKGLLRSLGVEGAFGSWGYYSTSAHKKIFVLARRYDNWTLIVTDREKFVIAPDELQLIDLTAQQIGQAETQTPEFTVNNWRRYIPAAIIISTMAFLYLAYKEPKVIFDSNAFKIKGIYGVKIPFTEIDKADTISWREMPAMSFRANGISLFKVHRGHFKTREGGKARLSVRRGVNPIIRIVKQDGTIFYINRKNAEETRQIYNQLRIMN